MSEKTYIKQEDCIARHVYLISSRNLSIGVFDPEDGGFIDSCRENPLPCGGG